MHAVVVYEAQFGNTRQIAAGLAEGLRGGATVELRAAADLDQTALRRADLLVVGIATCGWPGSAGCTAAQGRPDSAQPTGSAVRRRLAAGPRLRCAAALYEVRCAGPSTSAELTRLAACLHERGARFVHEPESFLLTSDGLLLGGQRELARRWGAALATRLAVAA